MLPNGVDTDKFRYVTHEPEEFTVGFAGRNKRPVDDEWKGYSKYVKLVCDRIGCALETADNLNKLYAHSEMPRFFEKITVLLLPSTAEGCSNTILEAQACGIPVITTRTGWHYETCTNYKELIFCSRNLIDIEHKVRMLMLNSRLRKQISRNARKFAEKHSWEAVAEHYEGELHRMRDLIQ